VNNSFGSFEIKPFKIKRKTKARFSGIALILSVGAGMGLYLSAQQSLLAEGSNRQALTTKTLRVCADPNNMPYSREDEAGLENKVARLVAEKLGLDIHYTWFPQAIGFVRNTLRLRECDLIAGITTSSQLVQNTNAYYRSVYVMIYRKDSGLTATTVGDPELKDKVFGVVAGTPPATLVAQAGLMPKAKPYQLMVDTRHYTPSKDAIDDLIKGDIDVALLWGPLGAWHANESGEDLVIVPLLEEDPAVRLDFRVSMAVRYQEVDWKHQINEVLDEIQPEIDEILKTYSIPLLDDAGNFKTNQ